MITNNNPLPPYPRIGQLYRALAVALGTKDNNSDVDALARKGEFNWAVLLSLGKELVVAPLAKYIDPEFAGMVGQSLAYVDESYSHLVLNVPLDNLSREESLPLLDLHYFALHALGLFFGIKKSFDGPDLMQLLDPELHLIAVVLAWLDEGVPSSLAKLSYPETTDTDREKIKKCRKWIKGTDLSDRQSIVLFATTLKAKGRVEEEKIQNLRCRLMVALTLAHLERESSLCLSGVRCAGISYLGRPTWR